MCAARAAELLQRADVVDRCICGAELGSDGHHGLACRRSAGRHRRHSLAKDVLIRAIRSTDTHAELEPSRLLRDDNKWPDGATFDPWSRGKYRVWDFTCPDTLAPSHLLRSLTVAGPFIGGTFLN